jgi:hypothetical protein
MTYYINKKTPAAIYTLPQNFDTLAEARGELESIRKNYAYDAPRGLKRERARWSGKNRVVCETTADNDPRGRGDTVIYTIFKQGE